MTDDPFIPFHKPEQFDDQCAKPLMCPPYEPDPSQSCPHLHCAVCKYRLARGLKDDNGKTTYSCFACDAIYIAKENAETIND